MFVGEALVGNDGVDQLVQFNRSLGDLSEDSNPRLVDGIVLTKFDTIDDKARARLDCVRLLMTFECLRTGRRRYFYDVLDRSTNHVCGRWTNL